MNQIEFDQEILRMREEKKEKLNPLYDKLIELYNRVTDLNIQIQKAALQKLEISKERKAIRDQIANIERTYREKQWLMNRELNEHKLSEAKEAE